MATGVKMPFGVTTVNALTQLSTVALGGSFGREAAPREMSAMWGGIIGDGLIVSKEQRRALVACGTGAGLAAVYSVPFSGVCYTIEHVCEGEISTVVLVAAVPVCLIASLVASKNPVPLPQPLQQFQIVPNHGLYEMTKKYSYEWPSVQLVLASAVLGFGAGIGAFCFRRLLVMCQRMKPKGRLPLPFDKAEVGHHAYLLFQKAGEISHRKRMLITSKTSTSITVCLDGDKSVVQEFEKSAWEESDPKGRTDWTILIVMPAAFFVLAVLSAPLPLLLGNGKAMATVFLYEEYDMSFLLLAFVLKALVTAGALGSGAAGGTLTPSIALGASLGAMVGWVWDKLDNYHVIESISWAVPLEQAGIIAASAFLGCMMKAPLTSIVLLMEMSDQGVSLKDFLPLFHGDASGLLKSKLAIGMWLPMGIAAGWATVVRRVLQPLGKKKDPASDAKHFHPPKDLDVKDDYHVVPERDGYLEVRSISAHSRLEQI